MIECADARSWGVFSSRVIDGGRSRAADGAASSSTLARGLRGRRARALVQTTAFEAFAGDVLTYDEAVEIVGQGVEVADAEVSRVVGRRTRVHGFDEEFRFAPLG